jgi:hypothetical protein
LHTHNSIRRAKHQVRKKLGISTAQDTWQREQATYRGLDIGLDASTGINCCQLELPVAELSQERQQHSSQLASLVQHFHFQFQGDSAGPELLHKRGGKQSISTHLSPHQSLLLT